MVNRHDGKNGRGGSKKSTCTHRSESSLCAGFLRTGPVSASLCAHLFVVRSPKSLDLYVTRRDEGMAEHLTKRETRPIRTRSPIGTEVLRHLERDPRVGGDRANPARRRLARDGILGGEDESEALARVGGTGACWMCKCWVLCVPRVGDVDLSTIIARVASRRAVAACARLAFAPRWLVGRKTSVGE